MLFVCCWVFSFVVKNWFWLDFCSRSWLSYERQKYNCIFCSTLPCKIWLKICLFSECVWKIHFFFFFLQNIQASYQSATLLKQVIITMLTLWTGFACSARCYLMTPVWMNKPCKEKCKMVYKCIFFFYCSFKIFVLLNINPFSCVYNNKYFMYIVFYILQMLDRNQLFRRAL